jgi:hypothetical protein
MDQIVNEAPTGSPGPATAAKIVRHFRQILLWPVHLLGRTNGAAVEDFAAELVRMGDASPWREVSDEFGEPCDFRQRHYYEFVTFLPPVQRFLYGQGLGKAVRNTFGESPIRVMRRCDIDRVRVTLTEGAEPILFDVAHIDLYFFFDIDIAMLAFEICAENLPLATAQEVMFRFGRAYPLTWEPGGGADDCPWLVEWLAADGTVVCRSDYGSRAKYLSFVCEHRAPPLAGHWDYLMKPLVLHHTDQKGDIRFRQLEDSRMPQMAYLAMEDQACLTRADYIRLAFASGPGDSDALPFAERHLSEFEQMYCYDRFDERCKGAGALSSRFIATGSTFVVTGDSRHPDFVDGERGYLARFRHQHFLLFMIAHFHKSAMSMFSDRLAAAVSTLDVNNPAAVAAFRAQTRQALERFLRFTHRYWFQSISNSELTHELFSLCRRHLKLDAVYEDIRQEVQEMSQYLENEAMRRQNDTVVRLTVVTILGLIGTIVTGFLGMNLFAHADESPHTKLLIFITVLVPTIVLTMFTVVKSRRLSDFLDAMADDTVGVTGKLRSFWHIWWGRNPPV